MLLASIASILVVRSNLSIKFYHPTTSLSRNLFVMQGNSWNCTTKYTKWTRCCTGKVYIFISEGNSILWFLKHVSKYEIKQLTVHTSVNFPQQMVSTGSCRYLFACSTLCWDHLVYQAFYIFHNCKQLSLFLIKEWVFSPFLPFVILGFYSCFVSYNVNLHCCFFLNLPKSMNFFSQSLPFGWTIFGWSLETVGCFDVCGLITDKFSDDPFRIFWWANAGFWSVLLDEAMEELSMWLPLFKTL